MHEASLAQDILRAMFKAAEEHAGTRIASVTLQIGDAAGVVNEALEFALVALAKDSIAQDLKVIFKNSPLIIRCRNCGHEGETDPWFYVCSACMGRQVDVISGREMKIVEMDIE